jgi:DNA-binding transcriptional LysR family regulator
MPNLRKKLPSANALFVFEAAARCGNFTRAAQELYVSQPAVSRMLARMEDHLGVQLFERARGGIELTENGRILYGKISEGFNGIEGAIREIEARSTGVESVTLSVSTAFTTHWLMPRMNRLNKAFPSVDLRFQLISGRIGGPLIDVDLGMRFVTQDEIDENSVLVMPELLLPVCNQRYHDQRLINSAGEHEDTVIVMDDEERGWHDRFAAFAGHRRRAAHMLSFNDYAIVVQAALLGQGVALGWLNVVSHWIAQGTDCNAPPLLSGFAAQPATAADREIGARLDHRRDTLGHAHGRDRISRSWRAQCAQKRGAGAELTRALCSCVVALPRARFRNAVGVMPQNCLKCRARWLWSKKPTSAATMEPGTPASSSICARSIRKPHRYR